jgi:release factor-specific protein-(glutamine-N5) methyltransferase
MATLRSLISSGAKRLALGPHPDRARQDAETLLLRLLGRNKAWLMAHGNDELSGAQVDRYAELLERRDRGEPIQYITGETEFYGLPFRVTPDVLIPRPETEHLVEKVLELAGGFEEPRIVDVGTGSGAIAIVLACKLAQMATKKNELAGEFPEIFPSGAKARVDFAASSARLKSCPDTKQSFFAACLAPEGISESLPGNAPISAAGQTPIATVTAIDLSAPALAVACENAERNGISGSIRFLCGDLLAPVADERFEIVVSNPPYVSSADRDSLPVEVRDYEPELALFAGEDGLAIYRRLIPAAHAALIPGGFVALEIGYGQDAAIRDLLAESGFEEIEFVPDLQGIRRVACGKRSF